MEDRVAIKLFKDGKEYKDDVFVGINGRKYLIQRGVEVMVPPEVAEVIRLSECQSVAAGEYLTRLVDAFDEENVKPSAGSVKRRKQ